MDSLRAPGALGLGRIGDIAVADLVYLALGFLLIGAMALYAKACSRL